MMVGIINIRHSLNDALKIIGGHIGFSVRKSQRQKGYATEILRLGLKFCKELKIERVYLTCDKENIASSKTILNNGGVLEGERLYEGRMIEGYWIDNRGV